MLTKYDEFFCHQIETTFDHVYTSAREWTERVILHFGHTQGKYHLSIGFGMYRNRNIMDAFAVLNVDGKTSYTVRASRALRPNPDEVKAGPFSYDVTESMKKVRCRLDDNQFGLSYDVEFEGTMPCSEEDAQFSRYHSRVIENIQRYVQAGRGSGWIKFDGNTLRLDRETCFVGRDHSWGIRRTGAWKDPIAEPEESSPGTLYSWGVFQFDTWGAAYHIREKWDGTKVEPRVTSGSIFFPYGSGKQEIRIARVEHDFKLRPDVRKLASGRVTMVAEDGAKTEISLKPLNFGCLKTGGYFPYRGFVHGQWMGPQWVDGFKLDFTDLNVLREASFLDDDTCELRCGDEKGYGPFELVVSGKYPGYGF